MDASIELPDDRSSRDVAGRCFSERTRAPLGVRGVAPPPPDDDDDLERRGEADVAATACKIVGGLLELGTRRDEHKRLRAGGYMGGQLVKAAKADS